jgi:endonuclease/exonuclease/phosphatase family metal-dependent hydrolase
LRLGTYNVLIPRTDTQGKGISSWLSRREGVIETIDHDFDFVGLQECSFHETHLQGQYIREQLTSRDWESYIPKDEKLFPDEFHERLPIFWRKGAFKLEEKGQLLLSSWTTQELEQVPILENRYGSYVAGKLMNGRKIIFVTVHLQHTTEKPSQLEMDLTALKRYEAHKVLRNFLDSRPMDESLFVAGDFNAPEEPRALHARVIPAENVAASLERWEHDSFHDWEHPMGSNHLDKVLVSRDLQGGHLRIGESRQSDHYLVSYTLP